MNSTIAGITGTGTFAVVDRALSFSAPAYTRVLSWEALDGSVLTIDEELERSSCYDVAISSGAVLTTGREC